MDVLETERLIMRPFTPDDHEAAFEALEGHPDVWRYDPGRPRTREERRELINFRIVEYQRQGFGCMAVVLKETRLLIGYCGLQLYLFEGEEWSRPEVELFYKFGRDHWGRGYASEAARRVVDEAFGRLRITRLITWTHRENAPSISLLQRLGMTIHAAPREPEFVIGILYNPAFTAGQSDGAQPQDLA